MAFLTVNNGPEAGKQYRLADKEYILGRHPDCQIVIDVGAVSRHHCRILAEKSDFFVEDLNSRNGTFLNDEQLEDRRKLKDGDQVRVCDVIFTFLVEEKSPPPTPLDDSSFRALLVDNETDTSSSTIMSKLDVTSSLRGAQLAASAQAKLEALIEIMQSLGKSLSLDKVLPQVLDSLFRIFHQADRGFIGLVDETGTLVPRWTKLRRADSDETIRVSRTIAKQVMESKEAILSADATSDSRFELSQSIADFRIRSMMCAPLIDSDGRAMGVLQIDTMDQRHRFQEDDLELLVSAAAPASIAVHNAQLHEEALKQRTLERDLELAREVQQAFLPDSQPDIEGYDFVSYYQAANHIGGDYYDYVPLRDGRLAVIVADVVGHGVAAAMLMAKLSAEARFCLASESHPAIAITKLNGRMCRLQLERFVTCVMVVLDPKTHEATIVNAGHMAPMHLRADGSLEEPGQEVSGLPLGIMEGRDYQQTTIRLRPGESLTLYTDGIDEAMNPAGKCYSIKRMREQVKASDGSPQGISQMILRDLRKHLAGRPQHDDMCMVTLRRG